VNIHHVEDFIKKNTQNDGTTKMSNLLCNSVHLVICKKRPGKMAQIIVLNEPPHLHMENLTMILATLDWEILIHSPYNPIIALTDFYLFGLLKEHLGAHNLMWTMNSSTAS
jgi:hypothetical protein